MLLVAPSRGYLPRTKSNIKFSTINFQKRLKSPPLSSLQTQHETPLVLSLSCKPSSRSHRVCSRDLHHLSLSSSLQGTRRSMIKWFSSAYFPPAISSEYTIRPVFQPEPYWRGRAVVCLPADYVCIYFFLVVCGIKRE